MNARTRYVLLGGSGTVTFGVLVAAVASLGLPGQPDGAPDTLRFVPAGASVVAYANVREVMASRFREQLRAVQPELDGQDRFREATGIDLERDIEHVVASMVPAPDDGESSGLLLLSGTFDVERLEGLIRQQVTDVAEYAGRTVFTGSLETDSDRIAMSFVDSEMIAMGSDAMVRHAIDVSTSPTGDAVVISERLRGLIESVRDNYNAWAVAEFDQTGPLPFLPEEVASQVPPLTAMAVGGQVNGGVSASLTVETRDEQASRNLREVVQGFIALARLQSGSRPDLQGMMDSVRLSSQGTQVTLALSLPPEILDLALDAPSPPERPPR